MHQVLQGRKMEGGCFLGYSEQIVEVKSKGHSDCGLVCVITGMLQMLQEVQNNSILEVSNENAKDSSLILQKLKHWKVCEQVIVRVII